MEKGFTSQQQTKDQNNGTLVQTLMPKEGIKKFTVDQITDPSAVLASGVNSPPVRTPAIRKRSVKPTIPPPQANNVDWDQFVSEAGGASVKDLGAMESLKVAAGLVMKVKNFRSFIMFTFHFFILPLLIFNFFVAFEVFVIL